MKSTSLGFIVLAAILFQGSPPRVPQEDLIWQHRNLGKAFYENPTAAAEAVEEFRKALQLNPDSVRERVNYGLGLLNAGESDKGVAELEAAQRRDPSLPHTWFNLGIAYKKRGKIAEAIRQFEQMVRLVPGEPVSRYNLGALYLHSGNTDRALNELQTAARLDPNFAAPRFQLFNIYRNRNQPDEAGRALKEFRAIKERQDRPNTEQEDVNWSLYSEIYDPVDDRASKQPQPKALRFASRLLPGKADPKTAGLLVMDFDADGRPDVLIWSDTGILLFRNGTEPIDRGLSKIKQVVSVSAGDYNNDGLADLCVIRSDATLLYLNDRAAGFRPEKNPASTGKFRKAVWVDYDHDRDLDLILLGDRSLLLRNQGSAGWEDRTRDFPFRQGPAIDGVVLRLIPDSKTFDIMTAFSDRPGVLYRDRLNGLYEAIEAGAIPPGASELSAFDSDNNGTIDLLFQHAGSIRIAANLLGQFALRSALAPGAAFAAADFANSGFVQIAVADRVYGDVNQINFKTTATTGLPNAARWVAADFNGDGGVDLIGIAPNGSVQSATNRTAELGTWLTVQLRGVTSLKVPSGTEVEVKAGSLYQKKMYETVPITFGLGAREQVDTVRITWPNGLIQNETRRPTKQGVSVTEAARLSGSCPMVFTWNGHGFEFISDVLGVAPLGASSGDGSYFPVDHDEYLAISGHSLVANRGKYEIRVTEELKEVSYLDQIQLLAVDHPAGTEVFTNERWKGPPYPEFKWFGVRRRIYPRTAQDDRGRDILTRLLQCDRVYVDSFSRDSTGVAEPHALELDFGPDAAAQNRSVLILTGWVDWADGSTFANAAQAGRSLFPPYLQVKDKGGRWQTVLEDMGMPSGKTKTVAIDLTGKFLSQSREVRIVTNMCVYWDQIFLAEDSSAPAVRITPVDAEAANLRFRGFSRVTIHPERKQPESFDYGSVSLSSNWNPTPGRYTRYGNVRELVLEPDDRMVIMGSGDELQLTFSAARLPALKSGWKRDFLLLVDGWAKDGDANTAFSQTVEPLPFHRMSSYPYPAREHFPNTEAHRKYLEDYNTRPELRIIRPLNEIAGRRQRR